MSLAAGKPCAAEPRRHPGGSRLPRGECARCRRAGGLACRRHLHRSFQFAAELSCRRWLTSRASDRGYNLAQVEPFDEDVL